MIGVLDPGAMRPYIPDGVRARYPRLPGLPIIGGRKNGRGPRAIGGINAGDMAPGDIAPGEMGDMAPDSDIGCDGCGGGCCGIPPIVWKEEHENKKAPRPCLIWLFVSTEVSATVTISQDRLVAQYGKLNMPKRTLKTIGNDNQQALA